MRVSSRYVCWYQETGSGRKAWLGRISEGWEARLGYGELLGSAALNWLGVAKM